MVKEAIDTILPGKDPNLDEIKDEVWQDLSRLYYKYKDSGQKRAFREVMFHITEKINEGKWDSIYHRLYKTKKKTRTRLSNLF